jgi:hypothetical protein
VRLGVTVDARVGVGVEYQWLSQVWCTGMGKDPAGHVGSKTTAETSAGFLNSCEG